jgi:hypothetical protein
MYSVDALRKFDLRTVNARVTRDLVSCPSDQVIRLEIRAIRVLIRTVLLDHEDRLSRREHGVELLWRQRTQRTRLPNKQRHEVSGF